MRIRVRIDDWRQSLQLGGKRQNRLRAFRRQEMASLSRAWIEVYEVRASIR
jgi:hypothetical protein